MVVFSLVSELQEARMLVIDCDEGGFSEIWQTQRPAASLQAGHNVSLSLCADSAKKVKQ